MDHANGATGPNQLDADAVLEMIGPDVVPGSTCAVLTPAMKAKLRDMLPGQVLEVRVGDPSAREDIAAWCRLAGHELLRVVADSPTQLRVYLRKKLA